MNKYNYPKTTTRMRPFYIEFGRYSPRGWTLFKEVWICSEEEEENFKKDAQENNYLMGEYGMIRGHPYNMDGGEICPYAKVSVHTEDFLKFMVDALNDKFEKEYKNK